MRNAEFVIHNKKTKDSTIKLSPYFYSFAILNASSVARASFVIISLCFGMQ